MLCDVPMLGFNNVWRQAINQQCLYMHYSHCVTIIVELDLECRMLNLELLLAYGPKSWQAHLRSLEVAAKR